MKYICAGFKIKPNQPSSRPQKTIAVLLKWHFSLFHKFQYKYIIKIDTCSFDPKKVSLEEENYEALVEA